MQKSFTTNRTLGNKNYELSNHLGNVLTVISDRKLAVSLAASPTLVSHYTSEILSANDYYSFGMPMPGRSYQSSNSYRYGMNGQEKDLEIFEGAMTAEFWEYDSRIGRRWNQDPVVKPWESSYATFNNNPNVFADPSGLDGIDKGKGKGKKQKLEGGEIPNGGLTINKPNENKPKSPPKSPSEPMTPITPSMPNDNTAVVPPLIINPNPSTTLPETVDLDIYNNPQTTNFDMTAVSNFKATGTTFNNPWPGRNWMNLISFPKPNISVSLFGFSYDTDGNMGASAGKFSGGISNSGGVSGGYGSFSTSGNGSFNIGIFSTDKNAVHFMEIKNSVIPGYSNSPMLHTIFWDVVYRQTMKMNMLNHNIKVYKSIQLPNGQFLETGKIMTDTTDGSTQYKFGGGNGTFKLEVTY